MSRASEHTCHALACDNHVPPRMHMCLRHWHMVPPQERRDLWAAYSPGQERRMDPSATYLRAAAACVRAVAELEGHDEAAIAQEVALYESWAELVS